MFSDFDVFLKIKKLLGRLNWENFGRWGEVNGLWGSKHNGIGGKSTNKDQQGQHTNGYSC